MRRSTRGGPERVLRTRRRCPQHCTPRGLHSSRGGRSAPHAAAGLPRTRQSLGHGRCHAISTVPRMPPWGSPGLASPKGTVAAMPPALTNTVPDAGSTVPSANLHALMATGSHAKWSANCMPLRGSRRPAGPLGTARNANCMHCMPCGHRVPCGHRCAMPTQQSRCPTRIGACYRVGERRSWRILAVVEPCLDLCRCGCWPRPCSCGRP